MSGTAPRTDTGGAGTEDGVPGAPGAPSDPAARDDDDAERAPQDPPQAGPAGRFARLRQRHARLSTANRIALYGLVCAVLAWVTPIGQTLWNKAFPDRAVALLVDQVDSICTASWVVRTGHESLARAITSAATDERQLPRWESEGKIVQAGKVQVAVTARGNMDKAVAVQQVTISVLRRDAPVRGTFVPGGGCGGDGEPAEPEYLVVDLDTLPVKQEVPVTYLQRSEQQKSARKAAERLGKPLTLPRQLTADSIAPIFLTGRTQKYDCAWVATVTWWDGEKVHKDRIDNNGRPFRVSAVDR